MPQESLDKAGTLGVLEYVAERLVADGALSKEMTVSVLRRIQSERAKDSPHTAAVIRGFLTKF